MKILAIIVAAIIGLILLVLIVGFTLPSAHVAIVRAQYRAPAERVFAAISDVESGPEWRTGLQKVEVLERQPLRWRETADWGTITFVQDELVPPARIVSRIADEDQGFGGTWTYEIAASPGQGGSTLTITEQGTVSNPMFRFMSKFVFGHYRTLETYAGDLARRLGETAQPVRVD
jgi:uncharacterized protein YndB with AHSA1/START domain